MGSGRVGWEGVVEPVRRACITTFEILSSHVTSAKSFAIASRTVQQSFVCVSSIMDITLHQYVGADSRSLVRDCGLNTRSTAIA